MVLVDCAGMIAERKFFKTINEEYRSDDVESIKRHGEFLIGDKNKEILKCFEEVSCLFDAEMLSHSDHWDAVLAVAKELERKKELSYNEVEEIYRRFVRPRRKSKGVNY